MKQFHSQGSMSKHVLAPPLPNSFSGLMEMYEANYIRLRKLLGDRDSMPEVAVSRVQNGMDLYLQVLEKTKYTSTIALTYYFADSEQVFLAYPNLKLRMYFDARQAEVMSQSYRRRDPSALIANQQIDPSLRKCWRMNRFLFKWLSYCDRQGHTFRIGVNTGQNQLITKNVEIPLQEKASSSNIIK